MMNNKDSGMLEQSASPSDRMKRVVINRYEKTENLYVEQNRMAFIYSCKALCNGLKQFISQKQRDMIDELVKDEEKELKKLNKKRKEKEIKSDEILRQKRDNIRFQYAEKKFDLASELLINSSIVMKDMEVDFKIPAKEEELKKLQEIIKNPIKREENERIY